MKGHVVIFLFFNTIVSIFQLPLDQRSHPPSVNIEKEALDHLGITDFPVDWRNAFVHLVARYKITLHDLEKTNEDLKKIKEDLKKELLMVSIRSRIEFWEDILAPNYKFTGKQNDNAVYINFHTERWQWILKNSNHPVITKMKAFIQNELEGDENLFCTTIAGFFCHASSRGPAPSLGEYSAQEVDTIMREKFNINDDITLSIIHFLTKA